MVLLSGRVHVLLTIPSPTIRINDPVAPPSHVITTLSLRRTLSQLLTSPEPFHHHFPCLVIRCQRCSCTGSCQQSVVFISVQRQHHHPLRHRPGRKLSCSRNSKAALERQFSTIMSNSNSNSAAVTSTASAMAQPHLQRLLRRWRSLEFHVADMVAITASDALALFLRSAATSI